MNRLAQAAQVLLGRSAQVEPKRDTGLAAAAQPITPKPRTCYCGAETMPGEIQLLVDMAGHYHGAKECEMRPCHCLRVMLSYGSPHRTDDGRVHSQTDCSTPLPSEDYECECGCSDFTGGGPTVRVSRDGARTHGNVLTCLGCGKRWYNTPRGLKRPHESALPPAWAMADLQGRAAKAQVDAQLERQRRLTESQKKDPVGPTAGFRKPPPPEPS